MVFKGLPNENSYKYQSNPQQNQQRQQPQQDYQHQSQCTYFYPSSSYQQHQQNKQLNQQPIVWPSRFGQLSGASDWGASGIQQGTTSSRDQNAEFMYNRKLRANLNIFFK
jgi:hypothetical protein